MSMIFEQKTESEPVDYIGVLETTEVSEKYWYLESVLKLEEEINRNITIIGQIFSQADDDDDIRVVAGIELSKSKMLKKGKLKMFRNLCLVALKEIPPIEGDKEVTIDDLEGFWCLLGLEADKHRQSVIEIIKPKPPVEAKKETICENTNTVPIKPIRTTSSKKVAPKIINSEKKAAMKVSKSNIDERNRKYMERMKKLKERKAKPTIKAQDKENHNPTPNQTPISALSKDGLKIKQCDRVLSPRTPKTPRTPRSPRIQWQM